MAVQGGLNYKKLDAWQKGRALVAKVYLLTKAYPEDERFGLTSQARRSAVSIVSNIAESQGRDGVKDTLYFLRIARGSLFELETQLILGQDLGFCSEAELEDVIDLLVTVRKLLIGLIKYNNQQL